MLKLSTGWINLAQIESAYDTPRCVEVRFISGNICKYYGEDAKLIAEALDFEAREFRAWRAARRNFD